MQKVHNTERKKRKINELKKLHGGVNALKILKCVETRINAERLVKLREKHSKMQVRVNARALIAIKQ